MKYFTRDFAGGLATIFLAIVYLVFSFRQRVSALADAIGPAGMPKVLGFLMLGLGIMLCAQSLYQSISRSEDPASQWQGEGFRLLRALGLLIIAIAYLLLVNLLGYALSIAISLALVALYLGAVANWKLVITALLGAGFLWTIFVILLDVPMPAGIFS
jgi:putative tricarboxylic transport membrane protein